MGIDVGIIGLGGAGRAHARRFRRNKAVGRILGFDIKPIDAASVPDVEIVASLEDLLSNCGVVSICTPDHLHLEGIVRCLAAGKHVLVEKPMVASLEEASRLREVLDGHPGQVFAVHHQMRYAPAFRRAAELIRSGALGKVFYLEANYWHNMEGRSTRFDSWRMEHGQSLIFGHSCHPLDLLMHLVGCAPESHATYLSKVGFESYATDYTSATTLMNFPGNVVAKSHVNSCCVYPQYNNLIVLGDKGSYIDGILYSGGRFVQEAAFFGKGKSDVAVNVVDIKIPRRFVSFAFNTYLRFFNWLSNRLMSQPDFGFRHYPLTVYNHDGACQAIVDNFVAAVQGREEVLVGYDDAARVIRLCEETERDGLHRWGRAGAQGAS